MGLRLHSAVDAQPAILNYSVGTAGTRNHRRVLAHVVSDAYDRSPPVTAIACPQSGNERRRIGKALRATSNFTCDPKLRYNLLLN